MGELPNDLITILEALARKEITVDEAEKLVIAIMSAKSEKNFGRRSKSFVGREFILNPGQEHNGDIEIVNGRAIINGKLNGNLEVVFGEMIFSGEVNGNVELVGTQITWNGGIISGNLQLVGCSYRGTKPSVLGNVSEIDNFFVNGILGMVKNLIVKPFLSGIKIEE